MSDKTGNDIFEERYVFALEFSYFLYYDVCADRGESHFYS